MTVTGPGGVGKTRLSIRVAESIAHELADGVWFIPLATVTDARHVPSAVSKVLEMRESGARPVEEDLVNFLRRKEALLLFDNFEHLLPASGLISELLTSCPGIKLLVTSQQPLRITGEHDFSVAALNAPLRRFRGRLRSGPLEAIHLFEDRARAVQPEFRLTDENIPIVEAICREVDGLPLAIELAAARMRFLSPEALLSRLVSDRRAHFQMLAGGPRDAPARHQSLHDTIAWSYRLLDESEQKLFRWLAVFQGGFSLEAAESICEFEPEPNVVSWRLGVFEGIASLVDKSLLIQREVDSPNPVFYMLATVRAFAMEELDSSDDEKLVRARHADYYLQLAERAAPELGGHSQRQWLDRLTAEHDNLQAALTWFDRSGDSLNLMRLTWALFFYWWYQGYTRDAKDWFERALAHELSDPNPLLAWVTFGAAIQSSIGGDYESAADLAVQARELAIRFHDPTAQAMALTVLAYSHLARGNSADSRAASYEAVNLLRSRTKGFWLANGLGEAGLFLAGAGDYETGIEILEEALRLDQARGDRYLAGVRQSDLGVISHDQGLRDRALRYYGDSINSLVAAGGDWYLSSPLAGLAALGATRDPVRSAQLLGAAQALREHGCLPGWATERERDRRATETARLILGNERFDQEFSRGYSMNLTAVVTEAERVIDACTADQPEGEPAKPIEELTPREVEVLRLVAAGLSDKEIGESLFISHRTASKHVANILAKMGVSTRSEAAVRAVRDGLR